MLVVHRLNPFKKTTSFSFPRTNHSYNMVLAEGITGTKLTQNWSFMTTVEIVISAETTLKFLAIQGSMEGLLLLLSVGLLVANAPDVLQPCGLLYYP